MIRLRYIPWIVVLVAALLAVGRLTPRAGTPNQSDSRAVAQDSLPDDVIVSASPQGEVQFEHAFHIDDVELECVECHHETDAARLRTPHEEYFEDFWIKCDHCHHGVDSLRLEARGCSDCHPDEPVNIAEEILSAKVAIHKNCWECHEIGVGVDASSECEMCHTGPREPR